MGIGITHSGYAQKKEDFKAAVVVSSDNDAFVFWQNSDQFYTFGAGIKTMIKSQRFLGLEKLFSQKKDYFFDFELRSEGFTSSNRYVSEIQVENDSIFFDRPFAGLLFGTTAATYTFEKSFIRGELLLGVMGPSSYAREIQDWVHSQITGDGLLDGWDFQIPDQLILNLNLTAYHDLIPFSEHFDVFTGANARMGNLYMDASPILGIRIGKFGPLATTTAFGNDLLSPGSLKEFYIKSTFSTTFTAFNGTAQGNLFKRDFEYAVEDLNQVHFSMSHGVYLKVRRYSLGFDHVFNYGKVIKGSRHVYGRIAFVHRF